MAKKNQAYKGDHGLSGFHIVRWFLQGETSKLGDAITKIDSYYTKHSVEVITHEKKEGQAELHYLMMPGHNFKDAIKFAKKIQIGGIELLLTEKTFGKPYYKTKIYPEKDQDYGTSQGYGLGALEDILQSAKEHHRTEPLTYSHLSRLLEEKGIPTINDPEEYVLDDLGNLERTSILSGSLVLITTPGPITLQEIYVGIETTLQPFGIETDEKEIEGLLKGLADVEIIQTSNKKPQTYSFNPAYL